ncbi:MAG: MFS transporter [Anaerolineae bacterium]|nr:MFS transporter [Anaerolineae bacterium]
MKRTPSLLYPRLFYLFFFSGMSSLMPYLAMHYESRGLSGSQIGTLVALFPLTMMVSAPLWSALADATRRHQMVIFGTTVGSCLAVALLLGADTFLQTLVPVFLFAFFSGPILPLADSAVLEMLGDRPDAYGAQRVLGTLGPAIAGPIVSSLVGRWGLSVSIYGYILFFSLLAVLLLLWKIDVGELGVPLSRGFGQLLRNTGFRRFLLVSFLGMAGYIANMIYMYVRMEELGAPDALLGFGLTMGTIGEIPFLLASGWLLRRFGTRGTITGGLLAMTLVLLGYALAPAPGILLGLQLLHGTAYTGMAVSGVAYAGEVAPPGMSSTAQGLFNAVYGGLAMAVGGMTSSIVREQCGSPAMFGVASASAAIGLAVFLTAQRRRQPSET